MTPRIREVLEERKDLGEEKFVFGAESGAFVASFDKAGSNSSATQGCRWDASAD